MGKRRKSPPPRNYGAVAVALCVVLLAVTMGLLVHRSVSPPSSSTTLTPSSAPKMVTTKHPPPPADGLDGIMATARGARRIRALLGFVQHELNGDIADDAAVAADLAPLDEPNMAATLLSLRNEKRLFTHVIMRAAMLWNGLFLEAKTAALEHAALLWKSRPPSARKRESAERALLKSEEKCNAILGALFDFISSPGLADRLGSVDDTVQSTALQLRGGDRILGALAPLRDSDSDALHCSIGRVFHGLWMDRVAAVGARLTAVSRKARGRPKRERALSEALVFLTDALEALAQKNKAAEEEEDGDERRSQAKPSGNASVAAAATLAQFGLSRGWLELVQLVASERCPALVGSFNMHSLVAAQLFIDLGGTPKISAAKAAFSGALLLSSGLHPGVASTALREWKSRAAFSLPRNEGVTPRRLERIWLQPRLERLRWAIKPERDGGLGLDLANTRLHPNVGKPLDIISLGPSATLAHVLARHAYRGAIAALTELLVHWPGAVDAQDGLGRTPMHHAALGANAPAVRLLLDHGANPSVEDIASRTPGAVGRAARAGPVIDALLPPLAGETSEGTVNEECGLLTYEAADMTPLEFELKFRTAQVPLLVRGAYPATHWAAATYWASRSRIAARYGDLSPVSTGKIPYPDEFGYTRREMTLREYILEHWPAAAAATDSNNAKDAPYLFSNFGPTDAEELWSDISAGLPAWLGVWMDASAGEERRAQIYVGPRGTGAPWHYHSQAFNALVRGSKQWQFAAPSFAHYQRVRGVNVTALGAASSGVEAPPLIDCTQHAGDIIYIPAGWGHHVMNLEEVAGFAVEESDAAILRGLTFSSTSRARRES